MILILRQTSIKAASQLFVQKFIQDINQNIEILHHLSFVLGIYW